MIRKAGLFAVVAMAAFALWLLDPINRLELRLWCDPMWGNSFWSIVKLGPNAPVEDVVQTYWVENLDYKDRKGSPAYDCRILETKSLPLLRAGGGDGWKAALIQSAHGREIVMMQFVPQSGFWQARVQK